MTDATRDLIQRLANALHDAAEDVGFWGSYASSYFQEKHDLPGNIAKIHAQAEEARAYLDQPEPKGPTVMKIIALAEAIIHPCLTLTVDGALLGPPSLKEQALQALENADGADHPVVATVLTADQHALIRKALEQLDD